MYRWLVSSLTGLDWIKQDNVLLFSCNKATKPKQLNCDRGYPPDEGECLQLFTAFL